MHCWRAGVAILCAPRLPWVLPIMLSQAVADRLYQLNPTGHVQHMSAHVYTRVGLYNLSIYQNKLANLADFNWSLSRAGGLFLSPFYRYQSHDIQFQTDAALRE